MADIQGRRISSARDILFILFDKKWVFLGIFVTVVVMGLLVIWLASPIYEVTGSVLVKPVDAGIPLTPTAATMRIQPVTQEDLNSEIAIMHSEAILRKVVDDLKLYEPQPTNDPFKRIMRAAKQGLKDFLVSVGLARQVDPRDYAVYELGGDLAVEPVTLSNMIAVSLKGEAPKHIANTVNAVLDAYIDYHIKVHQDAGSLSFFTEQVKRFSTDLQQAEEALADFERSHKVGDVVRRKESLLKVLETLESNWATVRSEVADLSNRAAQLKVVMDDPTNAPALTAELRNNGSIDELMRQLAPLLDEQERARQLYPDDSPLVQDIDGRVLALKNAIRSEVQSILAGIQLDLRGKQGSENSLAKDIDQVQKRLSDLAQLELEFDRLQRNLEQAEQNYIRYREKTEEARIEASKEASRVANVAVVEWARPSSMAVFPRLSIIGPLAVLIGLFAGLGGVFLANYMDHSIKTPEDLVSLTGEPVLLSLERRARTEADRQVQDPEGAPVTVRGLWLTHPAEEPRLFESFRSLGERLFPSGQDTRTSLCVGGAESGVGSSSICRNLALALSWDRPSRRLVVVETAADKPGLAHDFGREPGLGLVGLIREGRELIDGLQPTFRPNLDILPYGDVAQGELVIESEGFHKVLGELTNNYDMVLVDTGMLTGNALGQLAARRLGRVLLVVRAGQTRREVLQQLLVLLDNQKIKLLGTLLNFRKYVVPAFIYKHF